MIIGTTLGLIVGVLCGLVPLYMGIRAKRYIPALVALGLCALSGLGLGIIGASIALFLMVALMISYTYTDAQDPFLSRKAIEEVDFDETTQQYLVRRMAYFGNNIQWIGNSLWRNKSGFVGFVGLVFFLAMVTLGTLVVEYEARPQLDRRVPGANSLFAPPSNEFPLGLDWQGRDILSHVVHGGQTPILTSIQAGLFSTTIAVLLGSLAGLAGGIIDNFLSGLANLILTIPNFPLLLVLASIIRLDSNLVIAAVLSSLTWPPLMRSIRAQVLSLREREYIEAAFSLDLGMFHIITREVFPQLISYIAINFIFSIRLAMYALVALILLGMIPPREPDWATMLWSAQSRGAFFNPNAVMMGLAPVFAIGLFQLSLILFSRSLEEIFNPRLRSGV
ncbi:MAG: ABC transporter permease [Anaerolineales bacterium]